MKLKRFSSIFALLLLLSTFFSSFAFANSEDCKCQRSLVALGDSITFGYNLEPNQTEPSPNAFPSLIKGNNIVSNLGIVGLTSKELLSNLQKTPNAVKHADIVTLYIGGNDLIKATGLDELKNNPNLELNEEQLAELTKKAGIIAAELPGNLQGIINEIRLNNKTAPIILYNLYNPIEDHTSPFYEFGKNMVNMVNTMVFNKIASLNQKNNVHLADAFTAFDQKPVKDQYIISNDVHPTFEGHKALAHLADLILAPIFPEKELTINYKLDPSTTDLIEGPVIITVETNAEEVASMKWWESDKTEKYDITDSSFKVTKNGTYNVYVKDSCGKEAVETITISNIKEKQPVPNPGETGNQNTTPGTNNQNPTPVPAPTPVSTQTNTTPTPTATGHVLPDTATPMFNFLAIGLVVVLGGLSAMKLQQSRRKENL